MGVSRPLTYVRCAHTLVHDRTVVDRQRELAMGRRRRVAAGDERRAVAYLRVSTEEQHLGPEAQRAAVEAWAKVRSVTSASWHLTKASAVLPSSRTGQGSSRPWMPSRATARDFWWWQNETGLPATSSRPAPSRRQLRPGAPELSRPVPR